MSRRFLGSLLVTFGFALLVVAPNAFAGAPRASVTEFPLPHADSRPYSIVTGPDGNLWFTESTHDAIGKITPDGTITDYPLHATRRAERPLRDRARRRRRALVHGALRGQDRAARSHHGDDPGVLRPELAVAAVGDHGDARRDALVHRGEHQQRRRHPPERDGLRVPGQRRPADLDHHRLPTATSGSRRSCGNDIVRLDPNNPAHQTHFPVPTDGALPWDIKPGPDGNLWFTELAGDTRHIGKITPAGDITEYPVPATPSTRNRRDRDAPVGGGPLVHAERPGRGQVGLDRRDRSARRSRRGPYPFGITAGPDGNMWFAGGFGNSIGRINLGGRLLHRHLHLRLRLHHHRPLRHPRRHPLRHPLHLHPLRRRSGRPAPSRGWSA